MRGRWIYHFPPFRPPSLGTQTFSYPHTPPPSRVPNTKHNPDPDPLHPASEGHRGGRGLHVLTDALPCSPTGSALTGTHPLEAAGQDRLCAAAGTAGCLPDAPPMAVAPRPLHRSERLTPPRPPRPYPCAVCPRQPLAVQAPAISAVSPVPCAGPTGAASTAAPARAAAACPTPT